MPPELRTLPHDFDAEKAALGSVLIRPDAMHELKAAVGVDDFYLPAHREIFEAMTAIEKRGGAHGDVIGVADELRTRGTLSRLDEGEMYLLALSNAVPTAENVRHYVRIVREKAILRRLIAACAEAQAQAHSTDDCGGLLAEVRATIAGLDVGDGEGPVRIGDDMVGVLEAVEARAAKRDGALIKTGIASLDRVLALRGGHQFVIAARPGMGKTSAAIGIARAAAEAGVPSLIFSLEMSRAQTIERLISTESTVPGSRIARGDLDYSDWRNSIAPAAKRLAELPIWIHDKRTRMSKLAAEARRWRAKHAPTGPAIVIVDYLGLVNPDKDGESRNLEVGAISRATKELAMELDVLLILAAQLNRESVKGGVSRKPTLADLRDSGEIEQAADEIVFVYREAEADAPKESQAYAPEPTLLIVGKNRHGAAGMECEAMWDGRYFKFYDVVRADDRAPPENWVS